MNNLFIYFLLYISNILFFNSKTFLYGIFVFIFALFKLIKMAKENKKVLCIGLAIIFISLVRIAITKIPFPESNEYIGIILVKKDNYFIFFNGFKKFYVYSKSPSFDELDVVKILGRQGNLNFVSLEKNFSFQDYLTDQGIRNSIEVRNIKTLFDFPINFNQYKKLVLSNNFTDDQKSFIGGLLFSNYNSNNDFANHVKILNLFILFSVTGIYLNFFLYSVAKLLSFKLSAEKSEFISLIIFFPYLVLNITRFTTIKVLFFYVFRMINKYTLENFYTKIERISILGIFFMFINPFIVFSQAFYISYVISIFLNFSNSYINRFKRYKKRLILHVFLFFILLPFSIKNTYTINVFTSVAGYILISLFKPLFLFSVFLLFAPKNIKFYLKIVDFLITAIKNIDFKIFDINIPSFNQVLIILYFIIFIIFVYFLEINFAKIKKYILSFVLLFFAIYIAPINNLVTFETCFINVGQGDSTLIRYQNTTILVDSGGLEYQDLAVNTLIPFLKERRIYKVDALFITHNDFDHVGATKSLRKHFRVKKIYTYNDVFPIKIGNIKFSNLNKYSNQYEEENYKSMVLNFVIKDFNFLIMGDAPSEIEKRIIKDNKKINCDILKVGHHGSKTSTSEEFIKKVRPKEAVISCGYKNIFKHPHKEVLDTLNKYKIKIRRTDLEGTIKYKFWI